PFGQFAMDTLKASTAALASTDDAKYNSIENTIASLTSQRDSLAARMRSALNAAAFDGQAISNSQAGEMVSQAKSLLAQASALASSSYAFDFEGLELAPRAVLEPFEGQARV